MMNHLQLVISVAVTDCDVCAAGGLRQDVPVACGDASARICLMKTDKKRKFGDDVPVGCGHSMIHSRVGKRGRRWGCKTPSVSERL